MTTGDGEGECPRACSLCMVMMAVVVVVMGWWCLCRTVVVCRQLPIDFRPICHMRWQPFVSCLVCSLFHSHKHGALQAKSTFTSAPPHMAELYQANQVHIQKLELLRA